MFGGVDIDLIELFEHFSREGVEAGDLFDLIAKKVDPIGFALAVSGQDLERVAPHAENTRFDLEVVALVLNIDQLAQ